MMRTGITFRRTFMSACCGALIAAWCNNATALSTAQDDRPQVVVLRSKEPDTSESDSGGGLLLREIIRQAILISARDKLGLSTRDAALREPFPTSLPAREVLDVDTKVVVGKSLAVRVRRDPDDSKAIVWQKEISLAEGESVDYMKLIQDAELLSRTELVDALKATGFAARPIPAIAPAPLSSDAEARIEELNFLSQFAALRELHRHIGRHGESSSTVAALVRVYAHLGQFTRFYWNASHKVFKARSLLYAERLVVANPESATAVWHRAYARALAGFHAQALADLELARRLQAGPSGTAAEPASPPAWHVLIEPYCRYDLRSLGGWIDNPAAPRNLSLLFALLAAENSNQRRLALDLSEKLVDAQPDCFLAWELLRHFGDLDHERRAADEVSASLARALAPRLQKLADLPEPVRVLCARAMPSTLAEIEPKLVEALLKEADQSRDGIDPSWGLLARMIEEQSFQHVLRQVQFLRERLSVSPKEAIREGQSIIASHPYKGFVDSYGIDGWRDMKAWWQTVQDIDVVDSDFQLFLFIRATWNSRKPTQGQRAWNLAFSHADKIARDLEWCIYYAADDRKALYARELIQVSPHAPASVRTLVTSNWEIAEPHAAAWETEFWNHPDVILALGKQYSKLERWDDADRCLKHFIELAQDFQGYDALAESYKARGDEVRWLETYEGYLKQPALGLDHATVEVKIARHFMAKQQWEKALPYAERAAGTWAAWAMRCAAECHDALENWEKAEYWWRAIARRYGGAEWYFWCKRTGHGDVESAYQAVLRYIDAVKAKPNTWESERLGAIYLLSGQPDEAIKMYESVFSKTMSPYSGLHFFLLADQRGDLETRDKTLAQVIERGPFFKVNDQVMTHLVELAKMFHKSLEQPDAGKLDIDAIDRLIDDAGETDGADILYFAGRFLEIHGDAAGGSGFLQRCAKSSATGKSAFDGFKDRESWNHVLACDHLRSQKASQ